MRYFSMFSGIGGFELGISRAFRYKLSIEDENLQKHSTDNEKLREWRKQDASCVGFSEVDKYAIQIYQRNFPEHKNYGDATRIIPEHIPDIDFLCGGFPCQAFSIAGKRLGFNETRGTLFFDIARILEVKRPRMFLLENVKGLLSHDNGRTFKTIIATLAELGYCVEWQVLDSKDFGIPQHRERVFIIGYFGGFPRQQVFPVGEKNSSFIEKSPTIIGSSQKNAKISTDGVFPTLSQAMGMGGGQTPMIHGLKIRRITPKECERLQGFPDDWTVGVSDSQRYKCLGNAVTVTVIEAIVIKILDILYG